MIHIILIILCSTFSFAAPLLPSAEVQQKIFLALRDEMIRLDGEGLQSRRDRPENFVETTNILAQEILHNSSVNDFFTSFQKLSATYPNLHSRAVFPSEVESLVDLPWDKRQSLWMFAETDRNFSTTFRIEHIDDSSTSTTLSVGDEVVAINGRNIKEWLAENFLFCKFPLRVQCDRMLEQNLLSLNLSWKGSSDLIYTINHEGNLVDIKLKFKESPDNSNPLRKRCDYEAEKRYKGFKLVHRGFFACLYEKKDNPSVALLRISSFHYDQNQIPQNPFPDIYDEVRALENIWIPLSGKYKHLIVDVLDNHGGNLPVPYYQILFHGEFQEQYVQFKKTPEFGEKRLRDAIFWEDHSHELQFQKYVTNGLWDTLTQGSFTPPEPMFCENPDLPCGETKFQAKPHDFKGEVYIMVNEWCVSSCDGFTWALKTKLNAKLYGFPQASDSAYSRLRIDAVKDASSPDGFKIIVNPERAPFDPDFIVGQTISVSRSTDSEGKIFNGYPQELKTFVPYILGEYYPDMVLKSILDDLL